MMENSSPQSPGRWVPRNTFFFLALIALVVVVFQLSRIGLIARNHASAETATTRELASTFFYGLRFDLAIACYLLLPFVIIGHLPKWGLRNSPRLRRIFFWLLIVTMGIVLLLLLAEFEFFHEFQTRYNQIAFQYLDQSKTVVGMVWYNFPVLRYGLACALLTCVFALALRWIMRLTFGRAVDADERSEPGLEAIAMALVIAAMALAMRGGFQSEPLRWGDAYHSNNEFINQMSLNGLFALGQSAIDHFGHKKSSAWLHRMPIQEARDVARKLVVETDEVLIDPQRRTMLRDDREIHTSVSLNKGNRPPNVVLVVMESFSARFVGACGSKPDFTPSFDKIAADGILFDHAFSGGTHTHQGVFCSMLSFPNLPGYEYLMENIVSNQPFLTLPSILKQTGYQTLFLYNGNLSWDNMYGFFRKQGIDHFVGTQDYVNPIHRDRVWGVTDQDVFDRANKEFVEADKKGPFFSLILTLSNHAPFDLPEPLPFEHTQNMGELNKRIDGVRYADWAIGHFIEEAKKLDYFNNTLFVFVGDHGFGVEPKLTEANLLFHHVPLLFYSPLLSKKGMVVSTAASQLNIIPTVLGLLELTVPQSSWARNLFSTDFTDDNFVVFKGSGGSGSDQAIAMIRGDKMLVVGSDGITRLWSYRLNPDPAITPLSDPDSQKILNTMQHDVYGYVEAAMKDLSNQPVVNTESLLHPIGSPVMQARI